MIWREATSFLARRIIRHCGSAAELEELQRTFLVPLELGLLKPGAPPPGPEALSRLILAGVERQGRGPR
jgi:hypothetical protein